MIKHFIDFPDEGYMAPTHASIDDPQNPCVLPVRLTNASYHRIKFKLIFIFWQKY